MGKRRQPTVDEIWEGFARSRPEYYILTEEMPLQAFFASGRRDAESILTDIGPDLRRAGRAIDIGCGVGRLAIPMARRFDEVIGVDVSPTMLERLVQNCRSAGVENVHAADADAPWEEDSLADLVYSRIVFQHIEADEVIERYVRRIRTALAPDGIAHVQFDTRRRSVVYRVRNRFPNALLPKTSRRGLRRIRRSADWLRGVFAGSGLRVVREVRAGTEDHVFVLARVK